ncbi:hypothetical protein KC799_03975 [candidate division KSB1 bacterium]|nr:hypothetical protein [candidate division KSB1 bacterium]
MISTRLCVADLDGVVENGVTRVFLENLSDEAGAQVLKNLGVVGAGKELRQASREFEGHALALNLLGSYLAVVHDGEIRKRDLIPHLTDDEEKGGHAKRVMASYEKWLSGTPELNILYIMGLFDRPATAGAIAALVAEPAIDGLTDNLQNLSDAKWKYAIKHLRDLRLLSSDAETSGTETSDPELAEGPEVGRSTDRALRQAQRPVAALDCHPLIREHFGERLQQRNPEAWRQAHSRLYDYYKNLPEKELPDTLEEMEPLFAAVAHGCLAGKHKESLYDIYWEKIVRKKDYVNSKLGAFGSDVAVLSSFFNPPWRQPVTELTDADKAVILSWAGFGLRALGRLREAAEPMQAGLEMQKKREDWKECAIISGNLSELFLTLGDVPQAVRFARQSVEFADRSGDDHQKMNQRAKQGTALAQFGNFDESENSFRESEAIQSNYQSSYKYLYSLAGFNFCDLLLSRGQAQEALERAEQTLGWGMRMGSLLDVALDNLSLGRAHLQLASPEKSPPRGGKGGVNAAELNQAEITLNHAVAGLREAGVEEYVVHGLFARAALRRALGQFALAWEDLNEALEIAERGEMRLWLTDYHLEAARLCSAEMEAGSPPPENGDWKAKAKEHTKAAAKLVEETGYHRRDTEVAELEKTLGLVKTG